MASPFRGKFFILKGDITKLTVDCIVNAANSSLLGGGGVDGAIHRAAGPHLVEECRTLNGCEVGMAKLTKSYNLMPKIKAIVHTVGPQIETEVSDEQRRQLSNCYTNSLNLARDNKLRSIAFPCISTGVYNFPKGEASEIAIKTVKGWLMDERNDKMLDTVTFCVFNDDDLGFYEKNIPRLIA
uniref:Macro domain-containing protein n=1 Tax=Globodera rostochiensis TaxID=31243 RepID=A0A914I7J1_GLORO